MKILNIKRKSSIFYWALAAVMAAALITAGCKTEATGIDTDSGGKETQQDGKYTKVKFSELDAYLKTASGDKINFIEVTELTADDLKGETSKASKLGEALKKHSGKQVSMKFGGAIENLTDMTNCFRDCASLVELDAIPNGVTDISECFSGCTSLTSMPVIPASVGHMTLSFKGCENLINVSALPENVQDMISCFASCKKLTAAPDIPANITDMNGCFRGCEKLSSEHLKCKFDGQKLTQAFRDCTSMPAGGIKVPKDQLTQYQNHAMELGTTADKFSAEN
ncbi:MAG: leucine-rich repeat protein [Treponema sp.]